MSFDVASIRRSKPGEFTPPSFPLSSDDAYRPTGGLFTADFPLDVYIEFAYKIQLTREQRNVVFAHLPKWATEDNFEIHARAPASLAKEPTKDQMRLMMQSLLTERFGLALHFETQQGSVLALTLIKPGKTGPKLRPHSEGPPCAPSAPPSGAIPPSKSGDVYPPICDAYMANSQPNHAILLGSRNTTMDLIAVSLTTIEDLGRPVVDRTGLTGKFDFTLEWTPEADRPSSLPSAAGSPGSAALPDTRGTSFQEALKEQLGLKLESARAPLQVPVIDHIEAPSEN
ncbi:MAG TPA: TIGR03435 family protein [Acidobacteriaceae bacterium]|nr:TIGR03435 family protein [Acidobacteriaceae bacterium]